MRVPWRRRRPDPQPSSSRRDPRRSSSGARRPGPAERRGSAFDRRIERSRTTRESKRQRIAFIIAGAIIVVVAAIIGIGYYKTFIAPSRTQAARIRDTVFTQGDLVKRLRANRAIAGTIDLSTAPLQVLNDMVESELIRQGASFEGVTVSDEEVDAVIKDNFYPDPPEGQEADPGQLDREYQEAYRNFLTETQLSDSEYRRQVKERLYRIALRETLAERIPGSTDHVEASWIRLAYNAANDPENPPPSPAEVLERLKTEDFATVASQVSDGRYDSDRDGYIGWVPKEAIPELDKTLFGVEGEDPLPPGEVSGPITGQDATYIVRVESPAETRELEDSWREILKGQALTKWLNQQRQVGVQEGWLQVKFDSELYSWVVDQLRQNPTRTPAPTS